MSRICDLELLARPREKALINGIESLNDSELLAIIIKCGIKGESALEIANKILVKEGGLKQLLKSDIHSLMKIKGIKKAKAIEISAVIELMKRVSKQEKEKLLSIRSSDDVYLLVKEELENEKQECFMVVFLNVRLHVIKKEIIFKGGDSQSLVDINLVLKKAILYGVKKIICIHNHPSGDPTPSKEDVELTIKIKKQAGFFNIQLIDHIIIGENSFFSFNQNLSKEVK